MYLKTGNPNESAGKHRSTFSLRIKALKKKPHPVKIDLLVTNGIKNTNFRKKCPRTVNMHSP